MAQNSAHEASIPNPSLKPLEVLVGEWRTVGSHPMMPGITLHGHVSFRWIEGGAFLMMQSSVEEPDIPSGIVVFGHDDATEGYSMLYFDERGVSRIYEMAFSDNVWKYWRNAPGFLQRCTGLIADDGGTIKLQGELSRDSTTWEEDLSQTYTRIE
jgi:hypothetical protein